MSTLEKIFNLKENLPVEYSNFYAQKTASGSLDRFRFVVEDEFSLSNIQSVDSYVDEQIKGYSLRLDWKNKQIMVDVKQ